MPTKTRPCGTIPMYPSSESSSAHDHDDLKTIVTDLRCFGEATYCGVGTDQGKAPRQHLLFPSANPADYLSATASGAHICRAFHHSANNAKSKDLLCYDVLCFPSKSLKAMQTENASSLRKVSVPLSTPPLLPNNPPDLHRTYVDKSACMIP